MSGLIVLVGGAAAGTLVDGGHTAAVPWLPPAAVAIGLLPRR